MSKHVSSGSEDLAACRRPMHPAASALLLACRLLIGGLFVFSACAKLGFLVALGQRFPALAELGRYGVDPTGFAGSVKAFQIVPIALVPMVAYLVPWLELLCGAALILGVMSSGAAVTIDLLLLAFIAGMIAVIARGLDVECTCFGKLPLLGGKIGAWSIARNLVFMAIVTPVAIWGPGAFALERCCGARWKA